ncbi:hypothetical protein BBM20_04480 [Vibrio parahaemolyticus]|uniref:hypothetical protein n=4 Tax=Vibrio harveyi group TaxID=717610 RepID=UPI00084AACA3|nr:hypothetical protein [Vibrio harveyi]EJC7018487.1 hypothetical protein [Vibrio parahaemolyticus]ODY33322.1 hypothetical protein BBM20_04480 [Vibrio parahaemolyticus]
MCIDTELDKLKGWIEHLPRIGMQAIGGDGQPMYVLDLIMIGAIKRSLSLASGLQALVASRNMTCSRAIVRMELDTISRLLAYTYVKEPSDMATKVIGGKALNSFKCRDGKQLRDGYLIDRMTQDYPWVKNVYKYTSGYVHFSERQVFDSISSLGENGLRSVKFHIGSEDNNFPDESWIEILQCFNEMLSILGKLLVAYRNELKQAAV